MVCMMTTIHLLMIMKEKAVLLSDIVTKRNMNITATIIMDIATIATIMDITTIITDTATIITTIIMRKKER